MSPLIVALLTLLAILASVAYRELVHAPQSVLDYIGERARADPDHVRIHCPASVRQCREDARRHRQNVAAGRPMALVEEPVRAGCHMSVAMHGRFFRLFLHDGDLALKLLTSDDTCLDPYRKLRFGVMFPSALIASDGADWRRRVHIFKPVFNDRQYHGVIAELVRAQAGEGPVDLVQLFKVLAARVIGACAFGNRLDDDAERVARANTAMFFHTAAYMNSAVAQTPWLRCLPTRLRRSATSAAALCRRISSELIEARESGERNGLASDDDFAARAIQMMQSGTLTRDEVLDNTSLLIVAGHETTAYTMAWMGSLLARNPHIYERCRAEVHDVMGDDRDVTPEHLDRMDYVKATVTETLRMYPPIAVVERKSKKPFELSAKVVFRPGTSFAIDVWGIHHNERYWDDPYTARPERHLDSSGKYEAPPKNAFFPFSAGSRKCPGMKFAGREINLVWAYLLRNFEFDWKVDQDIPVCLGITISPAAPINAVLRAI